VKKTSSAEHIAEIKEKIREALSRILPSKDFEIGELKDEVWRELANLYYKFEVDEHKKAFREVMAEISDKISNGKWETVYKKLYREERKENSF
jgi:hypothetical protein